MDDKVAKWVRWPTSTNPGAFRLDRIWRDRQSDLGITCGRCGNIQNDRVDDIDRLVVECDIPNAGHFTVIWDYGSNVLSEQVVASVTIPALKRIGRLIPITTSNDAVITSHVALIGRGTPGTIRTGSPDRPTICGECGNFGYWPGWPPSKWQLLRRYWPPGADLALIGDWLLCSDDLWAQKIEPLKLPKVKGHKVSLVDEPADGLPADYDEMVAEVRRRGWIA